MTKCSIADDRRRDDEDLKLLNQFLNDIVLKWFLFFKPIHQWKDILYRIY